ncbi:hypothetical protein ACFL1V_06680 [Pseudomonadota bacterium]
MLFSHKYCTFVISVLLVLFLMDLHAQAEPNPSILRFKHMFGELGEEPGSFLSPSGIDELSDGRIVVFDSPRVQICDLEGACTAFGARGSEPGEFELDGSGLAVDELDRIVVSDTHNWRIQVCRESGDCAAFGRESDSHPNFEDVGTFFYPSSVDVDRNGQIWVGSFAYHRVQKCDFDGQCRAFGEPFQLCNDQGCEMSSFYHESSVSPGGFNVHVDKYNRVFLSRPHFYVHNILVCDQSNVPVCREFGPRGGGDSVGEFNYPGPMDSDDQGLLYVVDWANHRIQNCNVDSGECRTAGSRGSGPGQFLQLADISVREDGLLSSAEFENRRVQLFSINQPGPFTINAGLNDAWYNPETDGQGFFINVFQEHGIVFLSWFTYETEPRDELAPVAIVGERYHRWLTAQGTFDGNVVSLDVLMTSGGIFADSEEIVNTEPGEYGTISIEFHDCWNATLNYELHAVNESGGIPITRVAADNARVCEIMDFQ